MIKKFTFLASSKNPEKLSLTIKGFLMGLVPLIILVGSINGISITETTLVDFIQAFTTGIAGLMMAWGILRKFF